MLSGMFPNWGKSVYLKERLRAIYEYAASAAEAEVAIKEWCALARDSDISQMKAAAKTIESHMQGVLGFWRHDGATNAKQEGFNNKIRWLNYQAYGFRDDEYFVLKIYDLPTITLRKAI